MPSAAPLLRLSSRQNPVVRRVRAVAREGDDSVVLVEGATLAAEAVSAGWPLALVAVTESALAVPATRRLVESLPGSTERYLVTSPVMDAMSPVRTPSGLLALARRPPLVAASAREAAGAPASAAGAQLIVCAVDVQDPGNLGAIARVAEAAGATALVAAGASADPFGWKALRGSMGSAFRLRIARATLEDAVADARGGGCQVVATALEGVPLHEVDLAGPTCLLLGSEGSGLPPSAIAMADARLVIPMTPPVESLNVAVAAAVVLYEARRQRAAARRTPR